MNHSKSSTVKKEKNQQTFSQPSAQSAKIIPWPDLDQILEKEDKEKEKKVELTQKFLYYKGKKIPILQFQKSGYDKLLKLLVKEIRR